MIRKILSALYISACLPKMAASQQTPFTQQLYTGTGAYSQSQADLFSGFQQTAALASLKVPAAGVTGLRPYLVSALSRYQIQAAFPVPTGVMGLKADLRGNTGYREQQVGLSYARKLGAKLSLTDSGKDRPDQHQ